MQLPNDLLEGIEILVRHSVDGTRRGIHSRHCRVGEVQQPGVAGGRGDLVDVGCVQGHVPAGAALHQPEIYSHHAHHQFRHTDPWTDDLQGIESNNVSWGSGEGGGGGRKKRGRGDPLPPPVSAVVGGTTLREACFVYIACWCCVHQHALCISACPSPDWLVQLAVRQNQASLSVL